LAVPWGPGPHPRPAPVTPARGAAVLHWITPYDAENLDPLDAGTLVQWTEIADTSPLPPPRAQASRSGLQQRRFETQAITGTVILRGAVRGWGRYRLHPV